MRRVCPVEFKFDVSIERAKGSLRKPDQLHNESLEGSDNTLVNLKRSYYCFY